MTVKIKPKPVFCSHNEFPSEGLKIHIPWDDSCTSKFPECSLNSVYTHVYVYRVCELKHCTSSGVDLIIF